MSIRKSTRKSYPSRRKQFILRRIKSETPHKEREKKRRRTPLKYMSRMKKIRLRK